MPNNECQREEGVEKGASDKARETKRELFSAGERRMKARGGTENYGKGEKIRQNETIKRSKGIVFLRRRNVQQNQGSTTGRSLLP